MEVSVCSTFFIDSLHCLSRPEASVSRVSSSSLSGHRAPVSRLDSTLLPAHLRSRTTSSFFIRDILADRRTCSLLGPAGQPEPQTERLHSGLGKDYQNKSPSSDFEGEKPKIKVAQQLNLKKIFWCIYSTGLNDFNSETKREFPEILIRKWYHWGLSFKYFWIHSHFFSFF